MDDSSNGQQIQNVDVSIFSYINQKWGWKFYVPLLIVVISVAVGYLYYRNASVFVLLLIYLSFTLSTAQSKVEKLFMQQFAASHRLEYHDTWPLEGMEGGFFMQGGSKKIVDMLTGTYGNYAIKLFYYNVMERRGKNTEQHSYTVAEIIFPGVLPGIVVEENGMSMRLRLLGGGQKKLSINYTFDKYFSVYVPEDLEIETFEIFTPDVLEAFIAKAQGSSFEFVHNKLYVIKRSHIAKSVELTKFFDIVKYIIQSIAPRLTRLSDDVQAMQEAKSKIF